MSQDELLRLAAHKDSLTEEARTALQREIQKRNLETNPPAIQQATDLSEEPKPEKNGASWVARLGIFLCVAIPSAIIAAVVFAKGEPKIVQQETELLTRASLKLGFAAWALSGVVAGRWLTVKRTWITAITLYGIAFVLVATLLGKSPSTKLADNIEGHAPANVIGKRTVQDGTEKADIARPAKEAEGAVASEPAKMADGSSSAPQRSQPLVMDGFKDGVYLLHMGNIVIKARCVSTDVVSSDSEAQSGECNAHGPLEVPGDRVEPFQWHENPPGKEGTIFKESSYETFPNGEIDVSVGTSRCGATIDNGCSWAPWFVTVIYHFKVLEMKTN